MSSKELTQTEKTTIQNPVDTHTPLSHKPEAIPSSDGKPESTKEPIVQEDDDEEEWPDTPPDHLDSRAKQDRPTVGVAVNHGDTKRPVK